MAHMHINLKAPAILLLISDLLAAVLIICKENVYWYMHAVINHLWSITSYFTIIINFMEYICNKYCDLIGHSEVSSSHRDLQAFRRDPATSFS